MTEPRHALPADRDDMHRTFTEAFITDPMWVWLMPDPDRDGYARQASVERFMNIDIADYHPMGHTYILPGQAAALWSPPGFRPDLTEFLTAFGEEADPVLATAAGEHFARMMSHTPDEPHFYLHLIGARDDARGRGLGSILLDQMHATCDAEGIPAYLEASTRRSAALYARHGYEELDIIEFTPGVVMTPMLRQPR
ncbi:MAG: GNAT family N-acetyltransferase [Actinomycetota bacterium]